MALFDNTTYLNAFLYNDQRLIDCFYEKHEKKFKRFISKKYDISDIDILADIYQDTILRLWHNIQQKKITNLSLTVSLENYLYGVGENVARENLRRTTREILIEDDCPVADDENGNDFKRSVENKVVKEVVRASVEEYDRMERFQIIADVVNAMGEPCAPILLQFYWDGASMDNIATNLGYANGDSAKNQKSRCMKKLKDIFKSQGLW